MVKKLGQNLKGNLKGLRRRMNTLAEGRFRNVLVRLEQVPPLEQILLRLRVLRFVAYFVGGLLLADLLMLGVGAFFDKSKPPEAHKPKVIVEAPYVRSLNAYDGIVSRNAFCPGCPVPDMKMILAERPKDCSKAQAMQGSLKLVGTIVLSDPRYSVATVTEGAAESTALLVGDAFRNYGKVLEIRRARVCFLRDDNTLGYIDMPTDDNFKFGQPLPTAFAPSAQEGIARTSDTDASVKRSFLMQKLQDPNLLREAYAVPYTGEDGTVKGFRLVSVNPGSVYEALGIQAGDVITEVDGSPMTSVAKAQELFGSLRSRDKVSIGILRGGSPTTLNFNITK